MSLNLIQFLIFYLILMQEMHLLVTMQNNPTTDLQFSVLPRAA